VIVECCRVVCDWLNDPVNGVNALLPATPVDAGDSVPANLASIVDATRDFLAARGRLPANLPGIAIVPLPIENLSPHITTTDAEADVHLAIRLGMTKTQADQGFRDSSYYLRTILRSLRRLNANFDHSKLTRNGIYLEGASEMSAIQLFDPIEDTVITGAILITYHTRELQAT
jgi:hypothetical protein